MGNTATTKKGDSTESGELRYIKRVILEKAPLTWNFVALET